MKQDLDFIFNLGTNNIPFSIVFTKTDKLKPGVLEKNTNIYKERLLQDWEILPPIFFTSAANKRGREELLNYIENLNNS
jgi:GTP-binding protein